MKSLLLLMLCLSCTKDLISESSLKDGPWPILENFNKQSWNSKNIIEHLGEPSEVIKSKDGSSSWVYYDAITGRQSWAIGASEIDKKISEIAYFPGSSGKSLSVKELEVRWKNHGCTHSKETKQMAGHNYLTERFMKCDNGMKVIKYNRYGEVQGISIE